MKHVGIAVVTWKHLMLLVQYGADAKYPSRWVIPGGKIFANEATIEAVKRELWEETGLVVPIKNWEFLCTAKRDGDEHEFHVMHGVYPCDWPYLTRPPAVLLEPSMQGYGWFPYSLPIDKDPANFLRLYGCVGPC